MMLVLLGAGLGAWTERGRLLDYWRMWFKPQPEATTTVVYTWKDADGTVHYTDRGQTPAAKAVVVDTSRIKRLEPLPVKEKPEKKEKLALSELREDLQRGRDQMQAARERRMLQE